MRGHIDDALTSLAQSNATYPKDAAVVGLLRAELLYLNHESKRALEVLKQEVLPQVNGLDSLDRLVLEENMVDVGLDLWAPEAFKEFYEVVDRRKIAGFEFSDSEALQSAFEALSKGKADKAISTLSSELIRCHRFGCWRASKRVATAYAVACIKAGALQEACYYATLGQADQLAEEIASAIANRRDPNLVRRVVRASISDANLRRHFVTMSKIIAQIHDFLPDDILSEVVNWLLPRCRETSIGVMGPSGMLAAWEALTPIGDRLPAGLALEALDIAIAHPLWLAERPDQNRVLVGRDKLLKAVIHLVHAVAPEHLERITEATLPLAVDRVQNHDYPNVIDLLCNISELGGPVLKAKIAAVLYLPDRPMNRILAQLSDFFEKTRLTSEQLCRLADNVIAETYLQVQRLSSGEKAVELPERIMWMNEPRPSGELVVTIGSGVGSVALVRHREQLDRERIERLATANLAMALERDNAFVNRESQLAQLAELSDQLSDERRIEIFRSLVRVARGEFQPSREEREANSAPVRGHFGNAEDFQGMAIVCLAAIGFSVPALARKLHSILEESLTDSRPKIRRGAYDATRKVPDLKEPGILAVLIGTRDPDNSAAIAAFAALAGRPEWRFTKSLWRLFLLSVRMASQSNDVNLRRHAAIALTGRMAIAQTKLRAEADELLDAFRRDVAYSVRDASRLPNG